MQPSQGQLHPTGESSSAWGSCRVFGLDSEMLLPSCAFLV